MTISSGDAAPAFALPRDGGGDVSLDGLKGRRVVLYFYPKDDTPGCTTEALDITALAAEFDALGATVVGVSRDTVAKHDRFIEKHGLGVILGADLDGKVCEAYGVWVEKKNYGRTYMGIQRSTFLIDEAGVVREVWRNVRAKGHAAKVLEAAQAL